LTNSEVEDKAIEHVMRLERDARREPQDVRCQGAPYDISSPPRKIEVKAFGRSARGAQLPLEHSQVQAAKEDPDNFYIYVVDHVLATDPAKIAVKVLHGTALGAILERAMPRTTYWPTLRAAEYDQLSEDLNA
jgi:hypothetical protein